MQAVGLLQQVSESHSPYKRHLETEITKKALTPHFGPKATKSLASLL